MAIQHPTGPAVVREHRDRLDGGETRALVSVQGGCQLHNLLHHPLVGRLQEGLVQADVEVHVGSQPRQLEVAVSDQRESGEDTFLKDLLLVGGVRHEVAEPMQRNALDLSVR